MSEFFNPLVVGCARSGTAPEGELIDATHGELAEVSRERFPAHRLSMTRDVLALLATHADDDGLAALWDHVLRMAHIRQVRLFPGGHTFQIALGCRRAPHWHTLQLQFHTATNGEPRATVMLAGD